MAQHNQDAHVLQEQLRRLKKQLRRAEQVIKDKDEQLAKQQSVMKKNEESLAHMKGLMAQKGLESRDDLLREIDKQKRLAQEAEERASVRWLQAASPCYPFTRAFLDLPKIELVIFCVF